MVHEHLLKVPLLVFANKQDLPSAMHINDVGDRIGFSGRTGTPSVSTVDRKVFGTPSMQGQLPYGSMFEFEQSHSSRKKI